MLKTFYCIMRKFFGTYIFIQLKNNTIFRVIVVNLFKELTILNKLNKIVEINV